MTGPEHYRRAEKLEQLAVEQWEKDSPLWTLTIQQAQVHATLALAAATASPQDALQAWKADARALERAIREIEAPS